MEMGNSFILWQNLWRLKSSFSCGWASSAQSSVFSAVDTRGIKKSHLVHSHIPLPRFLKHSRQAVGYSKCLKGWWLTASRDSNAGRGRSCRWCQWQGHEYNRIIEADYQIWIMGWDGTEPPLPWQLLGGLSDDQDNPVPYHACWTLDKSPLDSMKRFDLWWKAFLDAVSKKPWLQKICFWPRYVIYS